MSRSGAGCRFACLTLMAIFSNGSPGGLAGITMTATSLWINPVSAFPENVGFHNLKFTPGLFQD